MISTLLAAEGLAHRGKALRSSIRNIAEGLAQLGCGLGAGIATIGAGLGIGKIGGQAMDAIARQPEASGKIMTNMILTSAFVEGCALFAIAACAFII